MTCKRRIHGGVAILVKVSYITNSIGKCNAGKLNFEIDVLRIVDQNVIVTATYVRDLYGKYRYIPHQVHEALEKISLNFSVKINCNK